MKTNADSFFEGLESWKEELEKLRSIILTCPVEEELKWGSPVYTFENKNIIGISGFKQHFALWFYNGVFLKDPHKLLVSAGDQTKSLRQIRLASMDGLKAIETIIADYIREAIVVEQAGLKIKPDRDVLLILPMELQTHLDNDKFLSMAFEAFTPGKKKEFANYIAEAKQPATRLKRVEKIIPMILKGHGLNDRYRNC